MTQSVFLSMCTLCILYIKVILHCLGRGFDLRRKAHEFIIFSIIFCYNISCLFHVFQLECLLTLKMAASVSMLAT